VTYALEGLEPCAVVADSDEDERPFSWTYHAKCAVHGRIFHARLKDTRAACLQDVSSWLESINCPGHIRSPDSGDVAVCRDG
jgi:hypothetical protein